MNNPYNLDDGVSEYFEFIVKGIHYRFRYPTTEESEKLNINSENEESVKKALCELIDPVDPKQTPFMEIMNKMTAPHWMKFRAMMDFEFGRAKKLNENNQSPKDTPTQG